MTNNLPQPVRIQRSRQFKQVSPNGLPIIYVGRPTKWGNPFSVYGQDNHWFVVGNENESIFCFDQKKDALDQCITSYTQYITAQIATGKLNICQLTGKNLSCWCKLDCCCHADVLLRLANNKISDYYEKK